MMAAMPRLTMPADARPGRHNLTARFEPTSEEAASVTSAPLILTVKMAHSRVSARAAGTAVAGTRGAKVVANVNGPRGYIAGRIIARLPDGRNVVKRIDAHSTADHSQVTLRLPTLKDPGRVRVKVIYSGNANVAASRTWVTVTVRPHRT